MCHPSIYTVTIQCESSVTQERGSRIIWLAVATGSHCVCAYHCTTELLNLNKSEASARILRKFSIVRRSTHLQSAKSISLQSMLMLRFTPRNSKWNFPHSPSSNSACPFMIHNTVVILIYTIIVQQMHTSILKLVYIHSEILQDSGNHVAIFREVKYKV